MSREKEPRRTGDNALIEVSLRVITPEEARFRNGFDGLKPSEEPYVIGRGRTNLLCGSCGLVLAQAVGLDQLGGFVLRCGRCGSHNEVPLGRL